MGFKHRIVFKRKEVTKTLNWKYPVNVEEMYIYCDEWDEFYNETVAKVAQAILEAEQIKET